LRTRVVGQRNSVARASMSIPHSGQLRAIPPFPAGVRFGAYASTGAIGQFPPFPIVDTWSFKLLLHSRSGRSCSKHVGLVVGHCGRWSINTSTAGIGREVDESRAILVNDRFDHLRPQHPTQKGRWTGRHIIGSFQGYSGHSFQSLGRSWAKDLIDLARRAMICIAVGTAERDGNVAVGGHGEDEQQLGPGREAPHSARLMERGDRARTPGRCDQ
jgi:hypothetical protein